MRLVAWMGSSVNALMEATGAESQCNSEVSSLGRGGGGGGGGGWGGEEPVA